MDENEKFNEKKKYNSPFLKAFDFLAKEKNMTDGQLAKYIGTNGSYISDLRNGKKRAGAEIHKRLGIAFGGRLYMKYLTGESQIMLLENVSDKEIQENLEREFNPDYDALQQCGQQLPQQNMPDISSLINSILAKADDAIEALKQRIRDKDEIIQGLRDQLADKNQIIAEQKSRLIDYRRIIDSNTSLSDYPFPVGAADGDKRPRLSK